MEPRVVCIKFEEYKHIKCRREECNVEIKKFLEEKLKELDNKNYHIQIHFKRPISGSRGSIDFDEEKGHVITNILCKIMCCKEFKVERRTIDPTNISRIAICVTTDAARDRFRAIVAPRCLLEVQLALH